MMSITRPRQYTHLLRSYRVFIDGAHAATIRRGQTVEIDLPSGRHSAVAVIDWCRSNRVDFDAVPGSLLRLEVGSNVVGWRLLWAFIYVTAKRDQYLYLRVASP